MRDSKTQSKTISIIIPVYNVHDYLADCIRSVLAQSYKELEIILVDDGSTDGSGELCDQWEKKDKRIRVIHQKNAGVSEARNTGIRASTGDFIGFIDADDWIEPNMYQELADSIIQNQTDIAMCGYYDYPKGIDRGVAKGIIPFSASNFHDAIIPVLQRNGYFTSVCNKLFTRGTIFRKDGIVLFDPNLAYGEDEVWFFKVFSKCQKVSFIPKPLYHWQPREESTTRTIQITKKHLSLIQAKNQVLDMLPGDHEILELARGRMYNDCYILKVYAYLSNQMQYYHDINRQLRPHKSQWLTSADVVPARKAKVILLDLLMKARAPKGIMQRINQIR